MLREDHEDAKLSSLEGLLGSAKDGTKGWSRILNCLVEGIHIDEYKSKYY